MANMEADVVVVGAGVVGLACAYAAAKRGAFVVVLERGERIGSGISSRNSEVIHAGLYYPVGSLRARLCVEGAGALYDFCDTHKVDYLRCGKLIVAPEPPDLAAVEALAANAAAVGVEALRLLSRDEVSAMEPELRVASALWSPDTGIIDSHGYLLALQGEIEAAGGAIALASPFVGAEQVGDGLLVHAGGGHPITLRARSLVLSAGLDAQACADLVRGYPTEQIPTRHLGKGVYFALRGRSPFQRLVYPPPVPGALGIHYTRDLAGCGRFGPDLEYVPELDFDVDIARSETFYDAIRRYWPGLPDGALQPDYAGIRPKLHGPGAPQADFVIANVETHGIKGLVALFGIESPGLTASLALGDHVADELGL